MTPARVTLFGVGILGLGLAVAVSILARRLAAERDHVDRLRRERQVIFQFLRQIGESMAQTTDIDAILRMVVQFATQTTDAQGGALFLMRGNNTRLVAQVTEGTFPPLKRPSHTTFTKILSKARYLEEALRTTPYPADEGILGEAVRTRRPVLVEDAASEPSLPRYDEPELELRTLLAAPLVFRDDVLGVLAVCNTRTAAAFSEEDMSLLAALAEQAAVTVEGARLYRAQARRERIDRDLRLAQDVQQILIPSELPHQPGLDCAGLSKPALQVGGDYYDVFQIADGRVAFAIADVSGKGVSAGLVMTMFRTTLRRLAEDFESPAEVLRAANRRIFPDIRDDMFVSVLYGLFDTETERVVLARAGHEPPLLRHADGAVDVISTPGMAVGIDPGDSFDSAIEDTEIRLDAGDLLVLYTDGITEARDRAGREFGRANLADAVATTGSADAMRVVDDVRERIRRFAGETPQQDDLTLLVIGAAAAGAGEQSPGGTNR